MKKISIFDGLFKRREGRKGVDWGLVQKEGSTNAIQWVLREKGFSSHRILAFVIGSLNLSMVIILIFCGAFGTMEVRLLRSTILTFFLVLTFLTYPLGKKSWREPFTAAFALDVLLATFAIVIQIYTYIEIDRFTWKIVEPNLWEQIFAIALFLMILEAARRTMGLFFSAICLFFLVEPLFSNHLPNILYGAAIDFEQMIEQQFLREDGIFGIALGVMVLILSIFLIFGAFLKKTATAQFFISLAFSLAGRFRGGAAKVAVISSGFMGSISGSVVANVATTGSVTIPMMRSSGYPKEFAGAVEAVASSGGQLMPPIMGIAAFLIAAIMGIPYFEVCRSALLPAVLYFFSAFLVIHLRAKRIGLSPLDKADIPSMVNVIRDGGFLLIPLFVIVYFLLRGYSAEKAVIISLGIIFCLSFIRNQTRLTPVRLLDALEEGGRMMVPIGIACASVGMIIGSLGASGLATRFTSFVIQASAGSLWIALVYTMLAAIVLGLGVPTAVVYVFLAVLVVPALIKMGVVPIAAHLFAFYFGVIGNITPPFALGSFAAAAISGASPMRTAFSGVRVGVACFLIPFIFVYAPDLLILGSFPKTLMVFFSTIIGLWSLASALEGWLVRRMDITERAFLLVTAIVLIKPGVYTDSVGLFLFCAVLVFQKMVPYENSPTSFFMRKIGVRSKEMGSL